MLHLIGKKTSSATVIVILELWQVLPIENKVHYSGVLRIVSLYLPEQH